MNVYSTIVEVQPIRPNTLGERFHGDVRPLLLDCGHVAQMNPTFAYKVGERHRCRDCEDAPMDDREAYLNLADEFDPMGATTPAVLSDFDPDVVAAARRYAKANAIPLPWDLRSVDRAAAYVRQVDAVGDDGQWPEIR